MIWILQDRVVCSETAEEMSFLGYIRAGSGGPGGQSIFRLHNEPTDWV
jgi:hypothetical protein